MTFHPRKKQEAYIESQARGAFAKKNAPRRDTLPAWMTCDADMFENHWLPLFESGKLKPEEAPVVTLGGNTDV